MKGFYVIGVSMAVLLIALAGFGCATTVTRGPDGSITIGGGVDAEALGEFVQGDGADQLLDLMARIEGLWRQQDDGRDWNEVRFGVFLTAMDRLSRDGAETDLQDLASDIVALFHQDE